MHVHRFTLVYLELASRYEKRAWMPFPALACFAARRVRDLEHLVGLNAGNFPGEVALRLDRDVLSYEARKVTKASVVITGTNGKTTTNNLIATCLEAAGNDVFCNAEGSNLEAGVVTALLDARHAPFASLECDEMYMRFVLPKLHPALVCLTNLYEGDQIYRFGSMDRIFDSIATAINKTSRSDMTLVTNADDPNCRAVMRRTEQRRPQVSFGIVDATPDDGADAFAGAACPVCGKPLTYQLRHFGQLGRWTCASCGAQAHTPDVVATNIRETPEGFLVDIEGATSCAGGCDFSTRDVLVPCTGLYMVYNVLAARVVTAMLGCDAETFKQTVAHFNPKNGRLQEYTVGGRAVMTNMAKNPIGFNQNIRMALKYQHPCAIAFLMDDMVECNGDYSWVDDIEFSALRDAAPDAPVFYGGEIAKPLERALAAAGVQAMRADTVADVLEALDAADAEATEGLRRLFVIANYHALERVCKELDRLST